MQRQIPLQKRSQTRVEQIIQSAETLFSINGIDSVSPSDIAEQANLTRTSLYRYFPNKLAIIDSLALVIWGAVETSPGLKGIREQATKVWNKLWKKTLQLLNESALGRCTLGSF